MGNGHRYTVSAARSWSDVAMGRECFRRTFATLDAARDAFYGIPGPIIADLAEYDRRNGGRIIAGRREVTF